MYKNACSHVWLVKGSEDGNMGAYTSKKKAFIAAWAYVAMDEPDINLDNLPSPPKENYFEVRDARDGGSPLSATVERLHVS